MSEDYGKLQRMVGNLKRALRQERELSSAIRQALGVETMALAVERVREMVSGMEEWEGIMDELEERRSADLAPEEKDARIAELEGILTEREHFDQFSKVAGELGVDPGQVRDLWTLSGYQPEGEADPEAIRGFLDEARASRPHYFAASPAGVTSPGDTKDSPAGPGASPGAGEETSAKIRQALQGPGGGRGVTNGQPGKMVVRMSETRDPAWHKQHGKAFSEAYAAGNVDFRENE